jgi:ferritin-like metal-binding protein YciE
MYVAELQELRNVEAQLIEVLRRMTEQAVHPELKEALLQHEEETLLHTQRLDDLLDRAGADPRAHIDQAMEAMVRECEKMMMMVRQTDLRDAGIIASAQKLEHYEIAACGTAAALAGQLGLRDDQRVLLASADDAKRIDLLLSDIAEEVVNPDALAAAA